MPNVVFFSFTEADRGVVLTTKGRAVNSLYYNLNFRVKDLLKRWNTEDSGVIRRAITTSMQGTSRTIVFVGERTYLSRWVREEVEMTLANKKTVYAIRLNGTNGIIPAVLTENKISVYNWSEARFQELATK
ncbi:molecular chaperone Tir [Labilibaculum sp. A4]|uniref:TIR domain-containing protein n=1 Tax=Labilibaculum euxinus TaxID=2686357 RepID=UPI000F624281|nr:TIR domain-containing protein [Labilibaculum euxinus]MDQ1770763.1 TIR domain-containing protein [Labilibaculum euxinus]MWN75934.1 molecular chaperone Tir [Labilibaculum euxinus]